MSDYVFGCPKCNREFKVLPEFAGEVIQCPHCAQKMRIPADYFVADVDAAISPKNETQRADQTDTKMLASSPKVNSDPVNSVSDSAAPSPADEREPASGPLSVSVSSVVQLLPPQFAVLDPTRFKRQSSLENQVLLPTAEGGVQSVSDRLVTIEYKGQKYTVVAMSPEQKRRRQMIVNVVSIFVAIGAIAGTIWILLK